MEIGENIRTIRLQKGMTQKQVADICGMADSAIRKYESGQIVPKISTIQRIATALGVDPYSLYSFDQATEALENRINTQPPQQRISAALGKLNDAGMEKAADAVEVIAEVPRYRAQTAPTASTELEAGLDTTPPPKGSEGPGEG